MILTKSTFLMIYLQKKEPIIILFLINQLVTFYGIVRRISDFYMTMNCRCPVGMSARQNTFPFHGLC